MEYPALIWIGSVIILMVFLFILLLATIITAVIEIRPLWILTVILAVTLLCIIPGLEYFFDKLNAFFYSIYY